jgi:hypothetical protein
MFHMKSFNLNKLNEIERRERNGVAILTSLAVWEK